MHLTGNDKFNLVIEGVVPSLIEYVWFAESQRIVLAMKGMIF